MLRPSLWPSAALLLLLVASGCAGPGEGDDDAASFERSSDVDKKGGSGAGTCEGGGALEPGSDVDPDDPCGSLLAEGEPLARAAWVRAPDPYFHITQPIGVSWFAEYAVRAPLDPQDDYTLELERCDRPARKQATCATSSLPLPEAACGTGFLRFGVDETQYRRGTNLYTFTLRLRRGCVVDSADAFSLTVEYVPGP